MAEVIRMPKMSDTMEEGVIASWLKKEGDTVKAGDILAEIETDKATMELEAYEDGTLLHIGVKEKEVAPIDALIAIVGEPGEDITGLLTASASHLLAVQKDVVTAHSASVANDSTTHATPPAGDTQLVDQLRLFASPLAKRMAQAKGYELSKIQGTGEGGRIIKRDVEGVATTVQPKEVLPLSIPLPFVVGEEAYEDVPISNMRRIIAKRLVESKLNAPHFYLTIDVAMDEVVAARISINAYASTKVSFNDVIIKAAAQAIRQHPAINVAWLQDSIRYNKHIHIGVAVAVTEGLVVPVLHFVDNKSLVHIAAEVKVLSQKAHNKQLKPQDLEGSTFTISNLGMLGIESFTAIVNPPGACILAIGAIKRVPVIREDAVSVGYVMKATLSCDHRVIDGAVGAYFLHTFKELLEDPRRMLAH